MKRITRLNSYESGLRQEINWCKHHKRIGIPCDEFKTGFIAGLYQAAKLLGKAKRLHTTKEQANIESQENEGEVE